MTKVAILILEIFAFFQNHYENISEDVIRRAAEELIEMDAINSTEPPLPYELLTLDSSGEWDPMVFRGGIRILMSFSLIKRGTTGHTYFEHPLVHLWSRDQLSNRTLTARCRSASTLLAQSITFEKHTPDYVFRRDLIPHIKSCTSYASGNDRSGTYVEKEDYIFAFAYDENGLWKEAEGLYVRVVAKRKWVLGEEHPSTLKSMGNLASTIRDQGRHFEAEALEVRVLEIKKRVLEEEHPGTLATMNDLALTFWGQGRYAEAEKLGVRALEVRKRVLGEENPDTLESMGNLTLIFSNQGRHAEAEALQAQVLEIQKRVLGEEHPSALMSMGNLASTLSNQGRQAEAEALQVRVVEISRRVLGEEHPSTLTSMNNLACTYSNQGRDAEAEALHVRALEIMKRVLGEEHPSTLASMGILASTFSKQKPRRYRLRCWRSRRGFSGKSI